MKTGAMVVGIIGGVAGLFVGILAWTIASWVGSLASLVGVDRGGIELLGFLVFAVAIAGLTGGALAIARPLPAGILMLVGGGGGFPLVGRFWLFPGVLLGIGGVLAIAAHLEQRKRTGMSAERAPAHEPAYPAPRAVPQPPAYLTLESPMAAGPSRPGGGLTVRTGPQGGRRFDLAGAVTTLGRSRDNDVVLEDPTVSRRHARISREGAAYVVQDLGSTAGTKLNGAPVQKPTRLTPGGVLRLGDTELAFEAPTPARDGPITAALPPQAAPETMVLGREKGAAWLLVQKGPQAGRSFVLQGDASTIGRAPDSAVHLEDPAVSRDHALLRRVEGQYLLYDLGSGGGTRVNGQALAGAGLREGGRITLGGSDLVLAGVEGGPSPASLGGTVVLGQERRAALLVRAGPDAGRSFLLGEELVIGREPGPGGAALSDPAVSGRHALVRRTREGYTVYDLGSANGTVVDGTRLAGRPLQPGDTIEVGATVLQFGQT